MNFDQKTDALDDYLNESGCALLSGMILSEQAGLRTWDSVLDANAFARNLVAAGVVDSDASIPNWQRLGDELFGPDLYRYHYEGPGYAFVVGDLAAALYTRPDPDDPTKLKYHFIACFPTEVDPYPNSITRKIGRLDSYRVFSKIKGV